MWWMVLKRAACGFMQKEAAFVSGTLAFYALLAFFPFIIFLTALAGSYGDTQVMQQGVDYMLAQTPKEVRSVLMPVIGEITQASGGGLLTVGLLGTLWVLMSGVDALRIGLNRAYCIHEKRSYIKQKLQSLGFIVVSAFSLSLVSVCIILGPILLEWLYGVAPVTRELAAVWNIMRYVFGFTLMVLLLSSTYYFLPNIHHTWRRVLPGAFMASILWLILASLFSVYLSYTDRFSVTYGSLSGIIIALVFLKASAIIFLLGAEVNHAYLEYRHDENRGAASGDNDATERKV